MGNSNSPFESGDAGQFSPDEAFAILGNETRVGILRVLWDAFESGRGNNAVAYSTLFDRVDIDDSGNFSYHLEKLTGPFVRRTDAGYELKQTGINVVRAVVSGAVTDDPAVGPTPVDVTCPLCDGQVEVDYDDELLIISCTTCDGRSPWNGTAGHLFGAFVPPVGVHQHSVATAFRAAVTYSLHEIALFHEGICPHCLGQVETTLDVCSDHRPDGTAWCQNCDRTNVADAWMVCSTCKRSIPPPTSLVALAHPAVTAFYRDHGVDHRFATWATVARSFEVDEEVVSEDPLRLRVTVPAGADELELTLDDDLTVVDATE